MSSRSQESLPGNIEDPRREGKEHCKVIKGLELNSSQEPPQDESMLQQPSHQDTDVSGQAAATIEVNQPINTEEEVATPAI